MSLITEISVHEQSFTVLSHEADIHNQASLYSISNYFQEAARAHAETLHLGIDLLRSQQKFWVLTRMIIEIDQYPVQGSSLQVRTWPKGMDRLFALRDFEMYQDDMCIARATSSWALLDLNTRRPNSVKDLGTFMFERENIHAIETRAKKLSSASKTDYRGSHVVRYSELDLNGHVNNTRYINWLMDTYTSVYHRSHVVTHLQTNYLAEVFPDQELTIYREQTQPDHFLFEVQNQQQNPLFRGELFFKPIP